MERVVIFWPVYLQIFKALKYIKVTVLNLDSQLANNTTSTNQLTEKINIQAKR